MATNARETSIAKTRRPSSPIGSFTLTLEAVWMPRIGFWDHYAGIVMAKTPKDGVRYMGTGVSFSYSLA